MKKVLSVVLSVLIAVLAIVPVLSGVDFLSFKAGASTAGASDAYATVFTASDFQDSKSGNDVEANFSAMIKNALANGSDVPDAFILGGDYESSYADVHSTPEAYKRVEGIITGALPYYNTNNIVNIQGNHDKNDSSVIEPTGLYEYEHFLVYVINNEDYPAGTGGSSAKAKTEATAAKLVETFDKLLAEGETRPIFIATHIPMHHNSRNPKGQNSDGSYGYNETLYSKILFDVIQGYSTTFDVVFFFGHNHSGSYDDYIGGSVNYLGKGEKIRIPDYNVAPSETSYTEETLNFTYMNYGYVGYTNNTNEKTLTMGAFEICPDRIEVTRYSANGVYKTYEIERNQKTNEPSVSVAGYNGATIGSATGALATASGFTDPVYTWTSSDNQIANISANGRAAQISYNKAGTATVTVTVTERNDSSKKASDSYKVTVENKTNPQATTVRIATQIVNDKTLEYYETTFGKTVNLIGSYEGLSSNAKASWSSSNSSVATVDQYGKVTFVGTGSAVINYTVTDTSKNYSATVSVRFVISTEQKMEYKYVLVDKSEFANNDNASYILASANATNAYIMSGVTEYNSTRKTDVMKQSSSKVTLEAMDGTVGFYWDDDSYVWNKVSTGTAGTYNLQNDVSGLYLRTLNSTSEVGQTLTLTSSPTDAGAKFSYTSSLVLSSTGYGPRWTSNGWFESNTSGSPLYLFKQVPLDPSADIEFAGKSANGTTKVVYDAANGKTIPLYGTYTNVEEVGSEVWTSSNTSVASVDNNGVLTFKGVQGSTTITYKVTDAINGTSVSASVTIEAKLGAEAKRVFRYTNKIVEGKNYIIVNNKNVGDGLAFSGYEVTYEKLLADRVDVKLSSDGYFQVEIPTSVEYNVWVPEKSDDGYYYLKNETSGKYLYAKANGTYDDYGSLLGEVLTSESTATNPEQFKWTASGGRLYNQASYTDSKSGATETVTYIRARSAEFIGLATQSQSEAYFYEEIMPEPNGVITSRYNVVGATLDKIEICPGQSETFVPKAENFPDNSKVDFTWSSDNAAVATIDATTGVITYTGKAGVVNVTLTSKSTIYNADGIKPEDTTSVKIYVNGGVEEEGEEVDTNFYLTTSFKAGNKYIIASSNVAGDTTNNAMSNQYYTANTILKAVPTTLESTEKGVAITEYGSNVAVFEAIESGVDGYVKLKTSDGKYLVVAYYDSDGNKLSTRLVVLADAGAYPEDQYLFKASGNTISNNQKSYLNYSASSSGGTNRWAVSSSAGTVYIYESTAKSSTDVVENAYYNTTELIPGKKYVFHTSSASAGAANLAIANTNKNANYVRLECVTVDAPQSGYLVTTNEKIIWECRESGVAGYYYFVNVANGQYLFISRSTASSDYNKAGVAPSTSEHPEASSLDYSEESFLIKYNSNTKMLSSKQVIERSSNSAYGLGNVAVSSSGYYYARLTYSGSTGSPVDPITLYAEPDQKPGGGDGEGGSDVVEPSVEIRKVDYFGSIDITDTIEYRYGVQNGDTEQLYRYVVGIQDGYTYTWSSSNTSIASVNATTGLITYTGNKGYVTFTLSVTGPTRASVTEVATVTFSVTDEESAVSGSDYPEYPDQGSVSIDKHANSAAGGTNFQNSGVAEIELSVTGIPVDKPVDVVVVLDHSESMNANNKLLNSIEDTRNFALQLFNANPKNRIAVVTFDQFRYNYSSITSTTIGNAESGKEDKIITGDGSLAGAFVSADEIDEFVAALDSIETNNTGGTNYDSGLNYAYRILETAKNDPNANDKQVVIFMSDGAATKFNGLNISSDHSDALNDAWVLGDETNSELATYLADITKYPAAANFNPNGDNWYAAAIKTAEGQNVEGLPNTFFYQSINKGLGATIFTIGYAVNAGSTEEKVLSTIASDSSYYYSATSNLQEAYDSILEQIDNAASNAVVTDKMGDHFDAMFETSYKMGNSTVTLTPAPKFEIGSWTVDAMGNRLEYSVIETITFTTNDNGYLTGATSSVLGDGVYDTANSKIVGKYVTYDLLNETFTWTIGDITRNEVTLKYYAILEGAAEGEREAGVFNTNEYANINYTNFKGNACQQTFPVPTLGWKQAAVSYEFYLVNDAGQPVNLSGVVVPFSERIIIGSEQTKSILLNSSLELSNYTLSAQDVLPKGYILYNEDAFYYISISSIEGNSVAQISDSSMTTYFRDGNFAMPYDGRVTRVTEYTNTAVSFAVKNTGGIIPDSVVIDFGLPVRINVLGNDYEYFTGGKLNAIGTELNSGVVLNTQGYATRQFKEGKYTTTGTIALSNGTASIDGETIVYTPTSTAMNSEVTFYYEYQAEDGKYYYTTVTIIPAANIYYEESFMTFANGEGYEWKDAGTPITGKFQAEDRPGNFSFAEYDANNAYGKDSAYDDSYTYSLGSAKYTSLDRNSPGKEPTATFTFSGTGFDLFSVTNSNTGAVLVSIYKAGTDDIVDNLIVNTYYGYTWEESEVEGESGKLVPDTTGGNDLYQVPVISYTALDADNKPMYGSYDVVIKPMYIGWFDMTGDGSYDIYVDSVRIFNPAGYEGDVSDTVGDAYFADGEFAPKYEELRDTIIEAKTYYSEAIQNLGMGYTGTLFVDGNSGVDELGIETYEKQGPNNEVYLGKNQAIAFKVSSEDYYTLASLQLGMKVVSGNNAQVVIMNTNEKNPNPINISGSTEQFQKLNSAIIWDQNKLANEGIYETVYPIVIVNTSDSVISLTSFKWAHTTAPEGGESSLTFNGDRSTGEQASYAVRRVMNNNNQSSSINDENISVKWSDKSFTEGKTATLTVTTPMDVVKVTVGGNEIKNCEIDKDGNKVWTYTFVVTQTGEAEYEILFYDRNGLVDECVKTETIVVEKAPAGSDIVTPEEPNDDAKESIIEKIINFIKAILEFFGGVFG